MNILGIDYGIKRTGFAICIANIVMPYETVENLNDEKLIEYIQEIVKDEKIDKIVLGMPISQLESKILETAKIFLEKLKNFFPISMIDIEDESYSTKKAISSFKEIGYKGSKIKKIKDMGAACNILNDYINKR